MSAPCSSCPTPFGLQQDLIPGLLLERSSGPEPNQQCWSTAVVMAHDTPEYFSDEQVTAYLRSRGIQFNLRTVAHLSQPLRLP